MHDYISLRDKATVLTPQQYEITEARHFMGIPIPFWNGKGARCGNIHIVDL